MKLIARDNYDRDDVSDYLIAEGLTLEGARARAKELNGNSLDGPWYYTAVPDTYVLHVWEP